MPGTAGALIPGELADERVEVFIVERRFELVDMPCVEPTYQLGGVCP